MKEKYFAPVVVTEELLKIDVLCASIIITDDNKANYINDIVVVDDIPGMD